jgi:hypothetical protein
MYLQEDDDEITEPLIKATSFAFMLEPAVALKPSDSQQNFQVR